MSNPCAGLPTFNRDDSGTREAFAYEGAEGQPRPRFAAISRLRLCKGYPSGLSR